MTESALERWIADFMRALIKAGLVNAVHCLAFLLIALGLLKVSGSFAEDDEEWVRWVGRAFLIIAPSFALADVYHAFRRV